MSFQASAWILAVCVRTPSRSNRQAVIPSGSPSIAHFFPVEACPDPASVRRSGVSSSPAPFGRLRVARAAADRDAARVPVATPDQYAEMLDAAAEGGYAFPAI